MKKRHIHYCWLSILPLALWACASVGSPKGGPKDINPPKLLWSDPAELSLNASNKRVEIKFNELVSLKSPSEKVLISPPQLDPPEVKSVGDKVVVVFSDSLKPKTTYSIDFTDAIVDLNEGNKFGDFALTFSTGEQIDSLRVSGILIDASNLNPLGGILVGTHSENSDSAFRLRPFDRISRSSAEGKFTIKGLPNGSFRVHALADKNRSYSFDNPDEMLAFMDSTLIPYADLCERYDTVWKDTANIDSVYIRTVSCFKPDDLLLRCFKEEFGRHYLARKERNSRSKISLTFGYRSANLPTVELLDTICNDWYVLEQNPTKDTLVYWIKDTSLIARDTIRLKITYQKSDSLNMLVWTTDTLTFVSRSVKAIATNKKKKEEEQKPTALKKTVPHLTFETDLSGVMEIYSKPILEFQEPIINEENLLCQLYIKVDTVWKKTAFKIVQDSQRIRRFYIEAPWVFEQDYKFEIDSAAVQSMYGLFNKKYSREFSIRAESDYSRLTVFVRDLDGPGFVDLLNSSDAVVRSLPIVNQQVDFKYLASDTYYLRAVSDKNGNKKWDTGLYAKKIQPESVFYNPKAFKLRENGDVEEVWNVHELPLLEQKPKELFPKIGSKQ